MYIIKENEKWNIFESLIVKLPLFCKFLFTLYIFLSILQVEKRNRNTIYLNVNENITNKLTWLKCAYLSLYKLIQNGNVNSFVNYAMLLLEFYSPLWLVCMLR